MAELLKRLDERFPMLSRWTGGRLRTQAPAFAVSVSVHVAILGALALTGYHATREAPPETTGSVSTADVKLPEFSRVEIQDLDKPEAAALSSAPAATAPTIASIGVEASGPMAPRVETDGSNGAVALAKFDVKRIGEVMLPAAPTVAQNVSIRGVGSEHVGDVEGAVDHVAVEVLRQLEQGRTLVVWAFDASASLYTERERLAKHIDGVYKHIAELDKDGLSKNDALLTAVVAFGQGRKLMTKPTSKPEEVAAAIKAIPLDESGVESTFTTVAEIAHQFGRYKNKDDSTGAKPYRTMIIVVTDEVGEDQPRLEEAIAAAKQAKTPVYVLGSSAYFGRSKVTIGFTHPKTGERLFGEVEQGPDSAVLETIHLPFWYNGPQYDMLDAGFGPFALSRLAGETGGIYFVTRLGAGVVSFDPNKMREYHPDWISLPQYEQAVSRSPLRQAVLQAAMITQQQLPGQPSLSFPAADGPDFKEAMKANQIIVARIEYTVKEALTPISAVSRLRDRETSRRWQAHYDLIRGRLLAMRIRCNEFNTACAQMLKDQPKFKNPGSNTWKLVPFDEINARDPQAKAVAAEARRLLKKVVDDHPGTPWALLAQREIKDPFGFKWVEANVPPRPKMTEQAAAKKKAAPAKTGPPRPPGPIKL